MRLRLFFILTTLLLTYCGCSDKVIYNNKTTITEKQFFSKWIRLDSGYYDTLKKRTWNLLFYAEGNKRKIKTVDSSHFGFKYINDSLINYWDSKDTAYVLIKNFSDAFETNQYDTSYELRFLKNAFLVAIENSSIRYVFIKTIDKDFLIVDIKKYTSGRSNRCRKYRLCFKRSDL